MASTNKTTLGLNQWVGTDKPKMADFNEDNRIIDQEVKSRARYHLGKYNGSSVMISGIEAQTEAAVMILGTAAGIGGEGGIQITSSSGANTSTVTLTPSAPLRAGQGGAVDSLDVLSGVLVRRVNESGEVLPAPVFERVQTGRVIVFAGQTTISCLEGDMEVTVLDPEPVSRALVAESLPDEYLATIIPDEGGVASVFGRAGIVKAQAGDYSTDQITETDARKFLTPDQISTWNAKASPESVQAAQQSAGAAQAKADAALPKAGGAMTGALVAGGSQAQADAQVRNIVVSTSAYASGLTNCLYFVVEG